jgi:hypothetical protein
MGTSAVPFAPPEGYTGSAITPASAVQLARLALPVVGDQVCKGHVPSSRSRHHHASIFQGQDHGTDSASKRSHTARVVANHSGDAERM